MCFRFAMKLLDKKRIKMKKGEHLALNERNILAKVCVVCVCVCVCRKWFQVGDNRLVQRFPRSGELWVPLNFFLRIHSLTILL